MVFSWSTNVDCGCWMCAVDYKSRIIVSEMVCWIANVRRLIWIGVPIKSLLICRWKVTRWCGSWLFALLMLLCYWFLLWCCCCSLSLLVWLLVKVLVSGWAVRAFLGGQSINAPRFFFEYKLPVMHHSGSSGSYDSTSAMKSCNAPCGVREMETRFSAPLVNLAESRVSGHLVCIHIHIYTYIYIVHTC